MATRTKKTTAPKKTSPKSKLAADPSVTVPVRRFIERLYTEFKRELVSTNIPALKSIAQDKDLISHYFLNRDLYLKLLGNHIALLDRTMRSSFASILTKDMMSSLFESDNTTFPGLWDDFHVKSLIITMINVATLTDDPAAGTFLSIRRHNSGFTTEDVKEFSPASWMPFNDYQPNRLYQFLAVVHQTALSTIIGEIETNVPAATFSASGEPVTVRYGRQLGELLYGPLQDKASTDMTIEEQADHFIKLIEKPLFTYMTVLLSESGFDMEAVSEALSNSKAVVTYSLENKGGKVASTFIHPWTKVRYTLINGERGLTSFCEFSPMDATIAANTMEHPNKAVDEETGEEKTLPPTLSTDERNACNRLGKSLQGFLDSLAAYMMNLAIVESNERLRDQIAAMNAAAASVEESAKTEDNG